MITDTLGEAVTDDPKKFNDSPLSCYHEWVRKNEELMRTSETNLQTFIRLLRLAYDASETVDNFDLHSEDCGLMHRRPAAYEESTRRWKVLLQEEQTAFNQLHAFCLKCPVEDLKVGE
jgi:hypothetical protein